MRLHTFLSAAAAAILAASATVAAQTTIASMEIEGELAEQPDPLAWLSGPDGFGTLTDVVEALRSVAEDDDVDGLVLRLKDAAISMSQVEEIGQMIEEVQAAGKRVHVYAEGYGNADLLLASYADEAILQAGGAVSLSGIYMEEMFLRNTLNWLGIQPDMVQVGDYKGANEMLMRAKPSEAWNENIDQLLDSMYARMREVLRENRGLSDEEIDAAMEAVWFADGEAAVELGLIDTVIDLPLLTDHLADSYGEEIEWTDVEPEARTTFDPANPFAILRILSTTPDHSPERETIAVLHVVGTIVDGESAAGGLLGGQSVGSRTIRRALENILAEDLIKGVVVRIDSPGGSAIASEVMWQGLQRVGEEKPVWISVGSMAASGGYYTAVGGERIYVNPSSIVGSIGVVGGKFTMGELYDKLRINVVPRSRGPRAGLFSTVEPWSEEQRQFVRDKMTETYDLFVDRVSAARPDMDISQTAEGRLFTGDRAVELNMADEIGSLDDAIADLAAELDLDDYDVMEYPGPKSFEEVLEDLFGGFASAPVSGALPAAQAVRELIGPSAWRQISNGGRALLNFRQEPVQTVTPSILIFD